MGRRSGYLLSLILLFFLVIGFEIRSYTQREVGAGGGENDAYALRI